MLYRRSLHARLFRTRKLAWNSLGKGLYKSQSGLTLKRWTWGHDANGVVPAMAGPASTETSLGACLGNSGFYWREEGESDSRLA